MTIVPILSASELTNQVFYRAWEVAQNKSTISDSLFQNSLSAAGSAPHANAAPFSFSPNVVEPIVNIPQQAEGASLAKFYELSTAVIDQLAGLFDGYMTKYFPDDTPYLRNAEDWIVNALTVGGTGLNPHIEAQMWERDRSRIQREASKLEEEAVTKWAARRFPLPPGAMTYQVLNIQRDAYDKLAQSSREIAIKVAEIELGNVRMAVESAIKLYSTATSAAMDYVKALAVGPQSGMQLIPSITDSQAKLIGAANEYYRSRISVEELRLKASMAPAEWEQQTRLKNADWIMEEIKAKVQAAIAAAQSMGTQAASALNSLHASAGISGSTNQGVQYSYNNDTVSAAPTVSGLGY